MRTHQPYHQHSYWNGVEACGEQVRDFIQFIDKGPNADNTVIMVVSDHGESLGENGFNFHSDSVQHVEAKVPIFIYNKGSNVTRGMCIDEPMSTVDIGPTILDIYGISDQHRECFLPGVSIFDACDEDRIRICESHGRGKPGRGRKTAIIQGKTKAVFHGDNFQYACDPHTEGKIKEVAEIKKVANTMFMGYKDSTINTESSLSAEEVDRIKVENSMKELGYL
jgi:arylsulfatase A-like enzyme